MSGVLGDRALRRIFGPKRTGRGRGGGVEKTGKTKGFIICIFRQTARERMNN
jgi:hypothetical protein